MLHRFEGFEFDEGRRELRAPDGRSVPLRPQVEALLRCFLERPGLLLSRAELSATLWPQAVVTDDSLVQCVGELRAVLGDNGQRFIHTARGKGYRWDVAVQRVPRAAAVGALAPASVVSPPPAKAPARRWPAAAAAAVVVAAAVGGLAAWSTDRRVHIDEMMAASSLVAVMPFSTSDADPETRRFADRAADAVVAQFPGRVGLRAVGRNVTEPYRQASPQRIEEALGARWVLRGQVAPAGARVAIDLQIHSVRNNAVGWSKHAEVALDDGPGLALIGQQVVNAVRNKAQSMWSPDDAHVKAFPEAVTQTMLGYREIDRRRSLDDVRRARARFEKALQVDPDSIIAKNGFATSWFIEHAHPLGSLTSEQIAAYERFVERMVAAAPNDPTALMCWGQSQIRNRRFDLAIGALQKAITVAPSYANSYLLLARAQLGAGHAAEVRALVDKVIERGEGEPGRVALAYVVAAEAALMLGNDGEALALAVRGVAAQPAQAEAHAMLAALHALAGDAGRAADEAAATLRIQPRWTVAGRMVMRPYADSVYVAQRHRLNAGFRLAGLPAGGEGGPPSLSAAASGRP